MTVLTNIKTVLEGDTTLLATATGGVYDYTETGRLGIHRKNTNTATAFDANGIIKPCILIRKRSEIPDGELMDVNSQYMSARAIFEIWFYADNAYTDIDTMISRVYVLLNATQVTGTFRVDWMGDGPQIRDDEMDAYTGRSDYIATVKRSA